MGKALQAVGGAALIGGAIVGAVLDPAMAPLWWSLGSMGVSMEVGVLAQALEGSQGNFSVKQAAAPGQAIYGMVRTAGNIVWASTTGGDKDYLHLIVVWAIHPCQSIEQIYIDGKGVFLDGLNASGAAMSEPDNNVLNLSGLPTAGNAVNATYRDINGNTYNWHNCCSVYQHLGGSTSTNPFINYLTPNDSNYPGASYFNGLTATYIKLIWSSTNFVGGIPEIRATIRGNNSIYDPRSGLTQWSDNMALCINNMLCDTNFGAGCVYGTEINQTQLIAAANICDSSVNLAAGGTESSWTCNGSFQTSSSPGDIVQSMLTSCAGRLTYTSGQFGIYPGAWLGTTGVEITTANTIGNPTYTATRKYRDLVNVCSGTFICPTYPYAVGYTFDYQDSELTVFNGCWQPTSFPYWTNDSLHGYSTATDYITQDQGRTLTTELKLQFVISVATAQRIAKITVLRNRWQGMATFPCNLSLWQSTALDNIEVLFPYLGLGGSTFEVQSIKFNVEGDPGQPEQSPTLTTELTLSQTDPSVYSWSTSEELGILITPSPVINDAFQIAGPTSLIVQSGAGYAFVNESGVVTGRILATWTAPADTFITGSGHCEVQWQVAGASYWDTSGFILGSLTSYLCSPCTGTVSYNVRVRGVRANGISSGWVQVSSYTCVLLSSTIDSTDTYYPDGSSVASLEPAMPGADITNVMTPVMVTNPGFEAGNTGWFLSTNTSIQKLPANAYAGSWVALSAGSLGGVGSYTYIRNNQSIAIKSAGQVITAQCLVNASMPAAGYVQVAVIANSASGSTNITGNAVAAGTAGWNVSSVVAVCPPGTTTVYIAAFFYGAPTFGNFFVDNFTANFQSTSLTEVPDDANYSKVVSSQLLSNQIVVYGNGAGVGVSAQASVTNQDISLNLFFNAQFAGTGGGSVLGNGTDGQPTVPTGSSLAVWSSVNQNCTFEGSGVILMPTLTSGGPGVAQFLPYTWVGQSGAPFTMGIQAAWAGASEPTGSLYLYLCPANSVTSYSLAQGVVASFPASAFTSTQFQTAILQGLLPTSGSYTAGYTMLFLTASTAGQWILTEPMLTYGGVFPTWTTQYPLAPFTSASFSIYLHPSVPGPVGGNPRVATAYCPTEAMLLSEGLIVGDAVPGDWFDCIDTTTWQPTRSRLLRTAKALAQCVRIRAQNGAVLECSVETPFTLPDGAVVLAEQMLGKAVLTDRVGMTPEWFLVTTLEHIGARAVRLLDLGGKTFAAGMDERRIYSHNAYKAGQTPTYD